MWLSNSNRTKIVLYFPAMESPIRLCSESANLTDYGTVLLAHLASAQYDVCSAADVGKCDRHRAADRQQIAEVSWRVPDWSAPTRGANGGYRAGASAAAKSVQRTSLMPWKGRCRSPNAAPPTVSASTKVLVQCREAPGNASTWPSAALSTTSR